MNKSTHNGGIVSRYFGEGWFAVFMISTVVFWHVLLLGLLMVPASESSFGEFAEDFRRRCLEYGTTGSYNWAFIIPLFTAPIVIGTATFLVYRSSLRRAVRQPATLFGWGSAGLAMALFGGFQLYQFGNAALERAAEFAMPLEFPADKLRTRHPPPVFTLTNQDGEQVSPQEYRGQVVVLTAVFARCAYT
jgi:protein SCO1